MVNVSMLMERPVCQTRIADVMDCADRGLGATYIHMAA